MLGRRLWGVEAPLYGLKCYRMTVYEGLGHFDSYGSISTEFAIYAARSDRVIVKVPIGIFPRHDASRIGAGWRAKQRIPRALARGIVRSEPGWFVSQ
jgi:hypothetical protein